MRITRAQKATRLAGLEQLIDQAELIVFINYAGLKAKEVDQIRARFAEIGSQYQVAKATLLRKALMAANLPHETEAFDQHLACIYGQDLIQTAKTTVKLAKEFEHLTIMGGLLDGQLLTIDGVTALAALPSREELLSRLVGSIASPLSGLVSVLNGNLRGLVQVLHQYEQQQSSSAN